MQGSVWIDMLRRIPAELHNTLALGLVTGGEIVVQQLIKMESDFVIIRGRMSGSTAEGRVMVVPYSHMTLIALNGQMPEPQVQALFGGDPPPVAAKPMPAAEAAAAAVPSIAPPAPSAPTPLPAKPESPQPMPTVAPAAVAPGQPKPPSKSILLARLRQRLAEKAK